MGKLILEEQATPDTPSANKVALYPKSDGKLYKKNDAGSEEELNTGNVATDGIWDAAGDLAFGTGSDTAAKLAIGSANFQMYVNAAGTTGEWAKGMEIKSFTRDTEDVSGDVEYTGAGFKPSMIQCVGCIDAQGDVHVVGFSDGTTELSTIMGTTTAIRWYHKLYLAYVAPVNPSYQTLTVKSLDSDGFTGTWTKVSAPTGVFTGYFIYYR